MSWITISLEHIRCQTETWDHAWQVDGQRDEIYIHYAVRLQDAAENTLFEGSNTTPTFGDTNGFPYRIKAGKSANSGGIRTDDEWDYRRVLYEGLFRPEEVLSITPTIWEWDGGQDLFNGWGSAIVTFVRDSGDKIAAAVGALAGAPGAALVKPLVEVLPPLFIALQTIIGQAKDRPVGLQPDNGTIYKFMPKTLILTEDLARRIEATDLGDGPGVVNVEYQDDATLGGGHYHVQLSVKVFAPLDGSVYREQGLPNIYVVQGGARFLADQSFLSSVNASVQDVPRGSIMSLPLIPRDNTLLRELSHTSLYVVQNGKRHFANSNEALREVGLTGNDLRVVPDGTLAQIPMGDPIPDPVPNPNPISLRPFSGVDVRRILARINPPD